MLNHLVFRNFFRTTLFPLFLIVCCPPAVMLIWYTNTFLQGSLLSLWGMLAQKGILSGIFSIWGPVFFGSLQAWKMIAVFAICQLFFMKVLPGKIFYGPITSKGNIPIYKINGFLSFSLTVFLYYLGSSVFSLFPASIIYDHFGEILGALNIISLFFCLFLYFKGRFSPSTTDAGITKNFIFDYYWGTELYPCILGWDVKVFTNTRLGLIGWALLIISFAAKQKELYGLSDSMVLAVILQLIYLTKFFFWERGYFSSLDIMHDRAGFYICWGCLVWLPCVYTSSTLYLVHHPIQLGAFWFGFILLFGSVSVMMNYFADRQRHQVRAKNGDCKVWAKTPDLIIANYTTTEGEKKQSLLLASGFWGIARHFHYVPEIIGAFCWTLPALFHHFLPYFYVIFLTILLLHRALRDDQRCAKKYGEDWDKYCAKVPYKIIPFVF